MFGDPNRQGDERRRTPVAAVVTSAHTPTPTASRATANHGQKDQELDEKITRDGRPARGALPRRARVAGEDAIEIREIRHRLRFAAMHADDADDAEGREKKQKKD